MTEEMKDQNKPDDGQHPAGEEPQVFSVKKDINGYKLNRRGFITTAAVTATTAALGVAISSQTDNRQPVDEVKPGTIEQLALEIEVTGMTILPAAATFERVWKITNKSAYACRDAVIRLFAKENPAHTAVFQIPEIPPGENKEVAINMAVPKTAGEYQYNWQIEMGTQAAALNEFSLVVTDFALAESIHPYENAMNQIYTIDNPDGIAQFTQIHFTEIHTEPGFDYVKVESPNGTVINSYTGDMLDVWSGLVAGSRVIVHLSTDDSVTRWGFAVDQLRSVEVSKTYLPIIFNAPTPTPIPTPTSFVICSCNTVELCTCNLVCVCEAVCSCDGYCSCDSYCTCNTVHYWYPN